jgi:hypothetical protein
MKSFYTKDLWDLRIVCICLQITVAGSRLHALPTLWFGGNLPCLIISQNSESDCTKIVTLLISLSYKNSLWYINVKIEESLLYKTYIKERNLSQPLEDFRNPLKSHVRALCDTRKTIKVSMVKEVKASLDQKTPNFNPETISDGPVTLTIALAWHNIAEFY